MSDVLSILGIAPGDLNWQDLALCSEMDTNYFYDYYESSVQVAAMIDDACLSCPVMTQCLQFGVENGETGVWGGIYLVNGRPDKSRNMHKTQDIWEQVRDRVGGEPLH